MLPKEMFSVALIGFGAAGRVFHAPLIAAVPRLRLTHVLERRAEESKARYPDVRVVRDVDLVLRDGRVDVVVLATPNATHAPLAARALRAGKHVVVDKPAAVSLREARELEAVAAEAGRVLAVFHNRRWDGDFLTVRDIVSQGRVGRVVRYESHFDRFRPEPRPQRWREQPGPGAGLLFDLGPHLIDQAYVLFGRPETVTAFIARERDAGGVDDRFDLVLGYPGFVVHLGAGVLFITPRPRFALHGSGGSYVKYGLDPQEDALRAGASPADPGGWGLEPRERWGRLRTADGSEAAVPTQAGRYLEFYERLCDALAGDGPPPVTMGEAAEGVRIIELAFRSAEEGRRIGV